jgi:hypothetical protein
LFHSSIFLASPSMLSSFFSPQLLVPLNPSVFYIPFPLLLLRISNS